MAKLIRTVNCISAPKRALGSTRSQLRYPPMTRSTESMSDKMHGTRTALCCQIRRSCVARLPQCPGHCRPSFPRCAHLPLALNMPCKFQYRTAWAKVPGCDGVVSLAGGRHRILSRIRFTSLKHRSVPRYLVQA